MRWDDLGSFDWFRGSQDHKLVGLTRFVQAAPRRRLILVGNSGEQDPEVFGRIAVLAPASIERILIRDVTGEPRDCARYAAAFRGVPAERWALFKDAAELADLCAPVEPAAPDPPEGRPLR
jgi:phosphatidate phosphatase APP1